MRSILSAINILIIGSLCSPSYATPPLYSKAKNDFETNVKIAAVMNQWSAGSYKALARMLQSKQDLDHLKSLQKSSSFRGLQVGALIDVIVIRDGPKVTTIKKIQDNPLKISVNGKVLGPIDPDKILASLQGATYSEIWNLIFPSANADTSEQDSAFLYAALFPSDHEKSKKLDTFERCSKYIIEHNGPHVSEMCGEPTALETPHVDFAEWQNAISHAFSNIGLERAYCLPKGMIRLEWHGGNSKMIRVTGSDVRLIPNPNEKMNGITAADLQEAAMVTKYPVVWEALAKCCDHDAPEYNAIDSWIAKFKNAAGANNVKIEPADTAN